MTKTFVIESAVLRKGALLETSAKELLIEVRAELEDADGKFMCAEQFEVPVPYSMREIPDLRGKHLTITVEGLE